MICTASMYGTNVCIKYIKSNVRCFMPIHLKFVILSPMNLCILLHPYRLIWTKLVQLYGHKEKRKDPTYLLLLRIKKEERNIIIGFCSHKNNIHFLSEEM